MTLPWRSVKYDLGGVSRSDDWQPLFDLRRCAPVPFVEDVVCSFVVVAGVTICVLDRSLGVDETFPESRMLSPPLLRLGEGPVVRHDDMVTMCNDR